MYEAQLQQLGLTEGESKVYEALLSLGPSTVGPIVKKSGIAYSNIYEVLERLANKGLVSFIMKEKTKYFQAVEPNRIKDYLDKKEAEIEKSKETFEKLLPQLNKVKSLVGKKEKTEIFLGEKGLRTAYETLFEDFKRGDEEMFFYHHDPVYYEQAEKFYLKNVHFFKQPGLKAFGISNIEYKPTKLAKETSKFLEQKYVSFPVPGNIDIFKDKVLIVTWREKPIGILIQSQEIADNFRAYFESVWKVAK